MTIGFVPQSIIDAFAKLGAVSMLQSYVGRPVLFSMQNRQEPTTLTYFLNADGKEIGCYDRINQVGVINREPRYWHDEFKADCGIAPIHTEAK